MRAIARTSRNTGVSVGPLGLIVLVIGGLIALILAAVVVLAAWIAAGAKCSSSARSEGGKREVLRPQR